MAARRTRLPIPPSSWIALFLAGLLGGATACRSPIQPRLELGEASFSVVAQSAARVGRLASACAASKAFLLVDAEAVQRALITWSLTDVRQESDVQYLEWLALAGAAAAERPTAVRTDRSSPARARLLSIWTKRVNELAATSSTAVQSAARAQMRGRRPSAESIAALERLRALLDGLASGLRIDARHLLPQDSPCAAFIVEPVEQVVGREVERRSRQAPMLNGMGLAELLLANGLAFEARPGDAEVLCALPLQPIALRKACRAHANPDEVVRLFAAWLPAMVVAEVTGCTTSLTRTPDQDRLLRTVDRILAGDAPRIHLSALARCAPSRAQDDLVGLVNTPSLPEPRLDRWGEAARWDWDTYLYAAAEDLRSGDSPEASELADYLRDHVTAWSNGCLDPGAVLAVAIRFAAALPGPTGTAERRIQARLTASARELPKCKSRSGS